MRRRHAEVAGAGFAGLTAAIALRQHGWTVRVHEKASELRAFGAGIVIWENGLRVLKAISAYETVLQGSLTPPFYETRQHDDTVSKEPFPDDPWRTMTREHLLWVLCDLAEAEGVDIVVDSEVLGADSAGVMHLQSGQSIEADLVVGADGVGSAVRASVGIETVRTKYHDGIVRLLVPRLTTELGAGEWDNVIDFWQTTPRTLRVLYVPCSDEDLYLGLMAPHDDPEGSRVPIDLDVWSDSFPQLTPVLAAAAAQPGRYDQYETTRLPRWTQGKVALVGDAAHAMTPSLAQGANCAMANAFSLAVALDGPEGVPHACRTWEARERGITDECQDKSALATRTRRLAHGNYTELLGIARRAPTGTEAITVESSELSAR